MNSLVNNALWYRRRCSMIKALWRVRGLVEL